ncbi:MAG: hypothetical protein QM527_11085 [Alphaproteobacteria bacterium]|nr:hypothetical protein [Alphaproteobacteria bacterium]
MSFQDVNTCEFTVLCTARFSFERLDTMVLCEVRRRPRSHRHGFPPGLSIVLYNGKRRWCGSTQLAHHYRSLPTSNLWSPPHHRFVMFDIRGQDARQLAKLNDNSAALVMQLERPHQYSDAIFVLLRLKELLPTEHE